MPKTLTDAYKAGVQAEKSNIAMYDKFLSRKNLPTDIKTVFTNLKNASLNHLNTFNNSLNRGTNQVQGGNANGAGFGMRNGSVIGKGMHNGAGFRHR